MIHTEQIPVSGRMYIRNKKIISAAIDTELVMMDVDKGAYFGLDGIGTRIWNLLAAPQTLSQLSDKLMAEYNVDRATCEQDIHQLLDQMQTQNLLLVAD